MTDPAQNGDVGAVDAPSLPTSDSETAAAQLVPPIPDDEEMVEEIVRDRRHERYLVRAAIIAVLVIAIAVAIRMRWG